MNAHQRRILARKSPKMQGCGAQFYSGTTPYPDLSCWDGRLSDDDSDGYDPTTWRRPCPHCLPEEHAEYLAELAEDV